MVKSPIEKPNKYSSMNLLNEFQVHVIDIKGACRVLLVLFNPRTHAHIVCMKSGISLVVILRNMELLVLNLKFKVGKK
jgi:hypothetical protein